MSCLCGDERAGTARTLDEVAHPLSGRLHITRMRGISADARDAQKLEELVEPSRVEFRHGGDSRGRPSRAAPDGFTTRKTSRTKSRSVVPRVPG